MSRLLSRKAIFFVHFLVEKKYTIQRHTGVNIVGWTVKTFKHLDVKIYTHLSKASAVAGEYVKKHKLELSESFHLPV